jgi:CheY-like chemotaxis protein
MSRALKVLLVEDSERDTALLKLYLRRGGYDADVHRVETRADLDAQLQASAWDLVISDFNLPGFDAFAAKEAMQNSGRDLPFIVLSGDFSRPAAEALTAAGIRYIGKSELSKLVPIIAELLQERA